MYCQKIKRQCAVLIRDAIVAKCQNSLRLRYTGRVTEVPDRHRERPRDSDRRTAGTRALVAAVVLPRHGSGTLVLEREIEHQC